MSVDGKYVQQFKKGALEMILLSLIARGETYGYELITALNDGGAAVFGLCAGGHGLSDPLSLAGGRADRLPHGRVPRQRRPEEILLADRMRPRRAP